MLQNDPLCDLKVAVSLGLNGKMQLPWNVLLPDVVLQCIFISWANTSIAVSCGPKMPFEISQSVPRHFFEHFVWWVSFQQLHCIRNRHCIWYTDFHMDMRKVLTEWHLFYCHPVPFRSVVKRITYYPDGLRVNPRFKNRADHSMIMTSPSLNVLKGILFFLQYLTDFSISFDSGWLDR